MNINKVLVACNFYMPFHHNCSIGNGLISLGIFLIDVEHCKEYLAPSVKRISLGSEFQMSWYVIYVSSNAEK